MSLSARFDRTISLVGDEAFAKLQSAHVLIVGLGGVGGAIVEVLARSGVGRLTLVDGDSFEPTNLNRQLLCTADDIGKNKADVAAARAVAVNPSINAVAIPRFFDDDNKSEILFAKYDYVADAIDDLKNKLGLIVECKKRNIPIISAMGAGNRLDCEFRIADIYKTDNDPFARKMRYELKRAGVDGLKVVCASHPPLVRRGEPASIAAPPLVMGAMIAGEIVRSITGL